MTVVEMATPVKKNRMIATGNTPKDEILALREHTQELGEVLARVQRKRRDDCDRDRPWKKLAYDQSAERMEAIRENERLRRALAECRQLSTSLLQFIQRTAPSAREMGTREETEWKLNVLGSHPRRRHWNADRIMEQMYRRLSSWTINSGLVDAAENTQFSRCENMGMPDKPIHVEVDLCQRVRGHYVDVAAAVWRYFARNDLETSGAASVRVEMSELLGDRIRHNTTGLRMIVDGRVVDHSIHQLCRRIEEDARIVIMWKAVAENVEATTSQFTDSADGWISFEKSFDGDRYTEGCLIKCSSMTRVLPVEPSRQRSGEYLLQLLRMMGLSGDLEQACSTSSDHLSVDTIEHARRIFADFLLETIWRHATHIVGLAARASSQPT